MILLAERMGRKPLQWTPGQLKIPATTGDIIRHFNHLMVYMQHEGNDLDSILTGI